MRLLINTFSPNKRAQETTEHEQACKVDEEHNEWKHACYWNKDTAIEEALDMMIALDGWLDKQPVCEVLAAIDKVRRKGAERGDLSGREDVPRFSDLLGILSDDKEGCERSCADRTCRNCARWMQSIVETEHYCEWHRRVTHPDDFCSRWVM